MLLPPNYMSTIPLGVLRILNERMYQSTWLLIVFRTLNLMAISAVAFCIVATPFQQERNQRYAEYIESIACGVHVCKKQFFFVCRYFVLEKQEIW